MASIARLPSSTVDTRASGSTADRHAQMGLTGDFRDAFASCAVAVLLVAFCWK